MQCSCYHFPVDWDHEYLSNVISEAEQATTKKKQAWDDLCEDQVSLSKKTFTEAAVAYQVSCVLSQLLARYAAY